MSDYYKGGDASTTAPERVIMMMVETSPEVVKILNKNFQDNVIAKELIEKEKIIRIICIKDIYGVDVYDAPNIDDKIFICKNIYEGVYFIEFYYELNRTPMGAIGYGRSVKLKSSRTNCGYNTTI